jgi:hypothetical protein
MAVAPVLGLAQSLLQCLEDQYPAQGAPPGSFCLRAGEPATVVEDLDPFSGEDMCCKGLGWVRLGGSVPSSNFSTADTEGKTGSCWPIAWATELEIGILRCYVPGATGATIPTCPQHTQAAVNYATDMCTIMQALQCFTDGLPKGKLWQIQGVGPSGPRTNCIMTVGSILVSTKKCCEEPE